MIPTVVEKPYKPTRRGRRGRGLIPTKIGPYSAAAAFTEKPIGKSKTLTPVGADTWVAANLGRDIAEALNTDQVTMEHRKMIMEHPQMSAAMLIFGAFLASARWRVRCEDPTVRAYAETLLRPHWRRLIRSMLGAVAFGYRPFERRYKHVTGLEIQDHDGEHKSVLPSALMYEGLKALPPDAVELWVDRDRYAGFSQRRFSIDRLEPEETFWYAHNMDAGQLFGRPRVNTGTRDFWVYNIIQWQNLMRYGTRIASPSILGYAPDGYRRKVDPETSEATVWQPIKALHDNARSLQEAGVLIMPFEESPQGKQRFQLQYLTDPTPAVTRITSLITESGHMMLYSVLLPPQMFQSMTPGRGQGYGSVASLGGLAAEGVDEIMADMCDWIENGNELYGVPSILQEPIRKTFGENAPHAYLEPNKTSRQRATMLGELLAQGIRTGQAGVNFRSVADELGVASLDDFEPLGSTSVQGRPTGVGSDKSESTPDGRAQTPGTD